MELKRQDLTIDLLRFMVENYGYAFRKAYRAIAKDTKSLSHMGVKNVIDRLEGMGVLKVEGRGTAAQRIVMFEEKVKEVLA